MAIAVLGYLQEHRRHTDLPDKIPGTDPRVSSCGTGETVGYRETVSMFYHNVKRIWVGVRIEHGYSSTYWPLVLGVAECW